MSLALLTIVVGSNLSSLPANAADAHPDLTVSISALSPSRLQQGNSITMTGSITNHDDHAWGKVQAYLVIPATPFTTRGQINEAIDNGAAYTGIRVVDPGTFDDVGDLGPGQTLPFRIKVPYDKLGISGAEGVYPVGVQLLGTDSDGSRSINAIARATTFLPHISKAPAPVPASIVWPFLMPDYRGEDGTYHDPEGLLASITAGGQLRNLLDLALSAPARASTVLLDPALLVGVDDLANQRHIAKSVKVTDAQVVAARIFLGDLTMLARIATCWVLGFDRPDVLALSDNADLSRPLTEAIATATADALTTYQLSGRSVYWPTQAGVTRGMLRTLRGAGDSPVIVTPRSLPGWEHRQGSIVQYYTPNGPMPLVVNDALDAGVPGRTSVVTLRQRILSEAALGVLQRTNDPQARTDVVTVVDPGWDPGPASGGKIADAFDTPFTTSANLDDLLNRPLTTYVGQIPAKTAAKPLSRVLLASVADLAAANEALASVAAPGVPHKTTAARSVASLLGVRWRADPARGVAIARSRTARAQTNLGGITIEGPTSVTLSSSSGGFPLTIKNATDTAIRVGVALDSSNPSLTIPTIKPIDIAARGQHTMTVKIDLGQQNTTTLTARLTSAHGDTLGVPAEFNVRSSKVGAVLWVALGFAGLLVLVALARRFHRSRTRRAVVSEPLDDDD